MITHSAIISLLGSLDFLKGKSVGLGQCLVGKEIVAKCCDGESWVQRSEITFRFQDPARTLNVLIRFLPLDEWEGISSPLQMDLTTEQLLLIFFFF